MLQAVIVVAVLAGMAVVMFVAGRLGLFRPIIEGQDYPATWYYAVLTAAMTVLWVVALPGWWKLTAAAFPMVWVPWLARHRPWVRARPSPYAAEEPGSGRPERMDDGETDSTPQAAGDQPPRCPPNYHWDESIGGCVPDGGGPYVGVREPRRPRRPGPTLTAEEAADRDD